jgi:hypothetical protein
MTTDHDDEVRDLPGASPCPFCGGTKMRTYPGSTFRWRYAGCDGCGVQCGEVRIDTISIPRAQAIEQAQKELLEVWNQRPSRDEAEQPVVLANEKGLTSTGQHIADCERDAARYGWLRDSSANQYEHPIALTQTRAETGMRYVGPVLGKALDDAIDAAMRGRSPHEGEKP